MTALTIWKSDSSSIVYENNKYSLYNEDKPILSNYDSFTPCANSFIIGCIKDKKTYKYQLINTNGDKIFGAKKTFELISYNPDNNKFTFFDYFNKIELVFPILSKEKNTIFNLFLRQIYGKEIKDIGNFQNIIDEISNRIENISTKDINRIIENLELTNNLYIKLNKPKYLKDYLIVLDKDDENKLLDAINTNKLEIFVELTKGIIKNPKIYDLNIDIINNLLAHKEVTELNQILTTLNNIRDSFVSQINQYKTSRDKIFENIESINKYFQSEETIKYFTEEDFNYIKKNKNLFLNIMYNKNNIEILNLLRYYNIS